MITRSKKIAFSVVALIAACSLFVLVFRPLIVPLSISVMLGLLLSPVVDFLERRRLPRSIGTLLCLIVSGLIISLLIGGFIPSAVERVSFMAARAPQVFSSLYAEAVAELNRTLRAFGFSAREVSSFSGNRTQILANILGRLEAGLAGIWATSARFLSGLVDAALVPFFAFFLIKDSRNLYKLFIKTFPRDVAVVFDGLLMSTTNALRLVLQGQLLLIFVDGILYVMLMTSLGLQGGVVLGVAAGLCRLVPYLDAITALSIGSIAVLTQDGGASLIVALVVGVAIIQFIDGLILTPRLVGARAGLHPAVVIGTVLAFGKVFGIWGVVFAIPVAASFKALLKELAPYYMASTVYSGASSATPVSVPWRTNRRMTRRLFRSARIDRVRLR